MSVDDEYMESELSNLPEEAHKNPFDLDGPFEPSTTWLLKANEEYQRLAMREWFLAHFCDPANDTPYNGREGGYLFIHGGPYDPADELQNRFSGIVADEIINSVIEEMQDLHGSQWAPTQNGRAYEQDEWFDIFHLISQTDPLNNLQSRLKQFESLLSLQQDMEAILLCRTLLYSAAVGALEAFLWETVHYWIDNDPKALHDVISKIEVLRNKNIKLGDIIEGGNTPKDHVKAFLQNIVWHKLDKVMPLFKKGLEIEMPSAQFLQIALQKRHHIVHRSGQDHDQNPVTVHAQELTTLFEDIWSFAEDISQKLSLRKH